MCTFAARLTSKAAASMFATSESSSSGQCVGVGSDFNDKVSSFRPERGLTCTIFSDAGCGGRATGGVVFPGIANLADFNNNDAMQGDPAKQAPAMRPGGGG
ncbi:hypothetical protein BDV93DRAFT_560429 [Ceratobasidium sp. AG-I]|nr:hypothetical protein BDV93DRAFT_560429 [Ceratobasidium sp. AG-I]